MDLISVQKFCEYAISLLKLIEQWGFFCPMSYVGLQLQITSLQDSYRKCIQSSVFLDCRYSFQPLGWIRGSYTTVNGRRPGMYE